MKKRAIEIGIPLLIVVVLVIAGTVYWNHKKLFPSTDDANLQANVVNIAGQINGDVNQVFVHENQYVKAGTLLFTIDSQPYQLEVNKAQAQLEQIKDQIAAAQMNANAAAAKVKQAQAELNNTVNQTHRILSLVKNGYVSKSDADTAKKNLTVAKTNLSAAQSQLQQALNERGELGPNNAELKAAETALEQAKLNLSYTRIVAPNDGIITNFNLRPGTVVSAFQPLFAFVETKSWWIEAYFKETDMDRIQEGQPAKIKLDMYPHQVFHGTVMNLSPNSSSSFSLLPPENASANWVKVTQRFMIKIQVDDANDPKHPLRLGASAEVTINTKQQN